MACTGAVAVSGSTRLPRWLRRGPAGGPEFARTRRLLSGESLHTVCEEARCPNLGECWSRGTATVLLLGSTCTRSCRFCAVGSGARGDPPDPDEPGRVAEAASRLGLRYVVLTSVTRDDLPDGGAGHYASAVRAVRAAIPGVRVEVLVPDFGGERASIETVLASGPHVLGHNLETVERLTPLARDGRASYVRSLGVLRAASEISPATATKSALLLGMGETREEVLAAMRDLRVSGVDRLALGQYLKPGRGLHEVARFLRPEEFDGLAAEARSMGFSWVASGPLVRSSFHAEL